MSNVKERIIGAVTVMNEQDAVKIWNMIELTFRRRDWDSIPEEAPDAIDLAMLDEIKNNPDCHEFVSEEEAMKLLGL